MGECEKIEVFNQKISELLNSKKERLNLTEFDILNSLGYVIKKGDKLNYSLNKEVINKLDINTRDEIEIIWSSL